MKKLFILLSLIFIISCEPNPTVKEGYILTETRPIGFKAEPVEAVLGDTVTMSLFVGGRTFSQDSNLPVSWLGISELTLPYNKPFSFKLPDNIEDLLANGGQSEIAAGMIDSFKEKGFADIPVLASFELPVPDTDKLRTLTVTKTIRIYEKTPDAGVRINPVIDHVLVSYVSEKNEVSVEVRNSETISIPIAEMPETIVLQSVALSQEETGYDRLNYSWYYAGDMDLKLEKEMKVELDRDKFGDFVPKDQKATQNREYFAISFSRIIKEIKDKKVELPVIFNFYTILRDRATAAESSEDYRWGCDNMWFRVEITE